MEIRRWHYYCIIFNCVLMRYLDAKTFSLNDVIAAESRRNEDSELTLPTKLSVSTSKKNSLLKRLSSTSRAKKIFASGFYPDIITPSEKIISPLKYKKTFQIKSPLKPKKLKLIQNSRHKRKNQSMKREINGNEKLKKQNIPLLRSLSMLFDNLLNSDGSESHETKRKKYKINRFYVENSFEVPYNCTHKSNHRNTYSKSQEKTITFSPPLTTEISITTKNPTSSEATSKTANPTTTRHFRAFRQNTNIPLLLPRNTSSFGRNDNGISEGSSAALHRNAERNITGHHGAYEHTTGYRENESRAENDEKNTNGNTRDSSRSFRPSGSNRDRNNTRILPQRLRINEGNSKIETPDDHIPKNQFEDRGDQTKSTRVLQEPIRRLRGFTSKDDNQNAESIQPTEFYKESVINVTDNNTGDKRITDRSSSIAAEDQELRKRNETMTFIANNMNSTSNLKATSKKSPVVMIFDGYSITRHKNGENKFSEKSIRIHS